MKKHGILLSALILAVFLGPGGSLAFAAPPPPIFSESDNLESKSPGTVDIKVTANSASGESDSMTAEIVIQKEENNAWEDQKTITKTEENVTRFDVSDTVDIKESGSGNYRMEIIMSDVVDGVTTTYEPVYSNTVTVTDSKNTKSAIALSVSPSNLRLSSIGGKFAINVASNASWSVSSNVGWIKASNDQGSNNGVFTITVSPSPGPVRAGIVTVTAKGAASKAIIVKQTAFGHPTLTPFMVKFPLF